MNQDQIALEYSKLLKAQLKNVTESECYMRFEIELNKSIRLLSEELISNKDIDTSSEAERCLHEIKQMKKLYQIDAHQALLTLVHRLSDKSKRQTNEAKKKTEQFFKRHGIENVEENGKNLKS